MGVFDEQDTVREDGTWYRLDTKPLPVDFQFLAHLCYIASNAEKFLNAVLDREPIAQIVRELSCALEELEMHWIPGATLNALAEEFSQTDWVRAELKRRDEGARFSYLELWSDGIDDKTGAAS